MAEESLAAGTRLGAFEVIRLLGHGGMGAVYEVRNVLTERRLALKVILRTHLADPDARARFLREVRIAAAIDHPNVVRVFELALHGDTMLLPMELVEGVTLRQHLTGEDERARRLPVAEMVSLLVQVCEGVAAVHAKGVIHRDLKPANVMVVQGEKAERVAKVLDFGAARHIDRHDEHTRAGLALGTPPYMAPEQLAAAPDLDARVDVYALGVIAYEALVGQRPHGASGGAEVMAKVFTQAPFPRPRAVRGDLPDALDHAVMHALAFARDERTPSPSHATNARSRSSRCAMRCAPRWSQLLASSVTLSPSCGPRSWWSSVRPRPCARGPRPAPFVPGGRSPRWPCRSWDSPRPSARPAGPRRPPSPVSPPQGRWPRLPGWSPMFLSRNGLCPILPPRRSSPSTRATSTETRSRRSRRRRPMRRLARAPVGGSRNGRDDEARRAARAPRLGGGAGPSLFGERPRRRRACPRAGDGPARGQPRTVSGQRRRAPRGRARGHRGVRRRDVRGLLHRALAREALAEHPLAARDLDAFLLRDPIRAADPFVRALRERLDARVRRVGVTRPDGVPVRVQVDGEWLERDAQALAVSPGDVRVRVEAEGFVAAERPVRVAAGDRVTLGVRREDDPVRATTELVLRRVVVVRPEAPRTGAGGEHPLRPWAITASAAAGVNLALGVGMLVWRTSSASTYSGLGCEGMSAPSAACLDTYAQFRDANAAAVATLVSAGVLAVAAGALWIVDLRRSRSQRWACAPGPLGFTCGARF